MADDGRVTVDSGGTDPSRRRFVLRGLAIVAGGIAAILGIPVVGFGAAPAWLWREEDDPELVETSIPPTLRSSAWTSVGRLSDLELGVPTYVIVNRPIVDGWVRTDAPVGVYVVKQSDTAAVAFDSHCTHLGCPLAALRGANSFVCPCHGGSFDTNGEVTSGPPPHAMFRYEVRVDGNDVLIGALLVEV